MNSVTDVDPLRRGLDQMVGKTFKLSRFLFTFPFYFSKDNLHVSYKYFFLSLIVVGYVSMVSILYAKDIFITIPDPKVIKFSFYSPAICFTVIPVCHLAWLLYKKNKLVEFLKIIQDVEAVTGYSTPVPSTKMIFITSLLLISNVIANYRFVEHYFIGKFLVYLSGITVVSVLAQFNSLIGVTKSQYQYLLDTLDHTTVEKWCCCREQLAKSCRAMNDCYAPQLLLMVTTNFVGVVCNSYQFAVSAVIQSDLLIAVMCAVWAFLYCFMTWFIIFLCDSTLSKAKKFDNMVYYMIMNDPTKTLVKNKRIIIHFKANRKEEFSAMGFFNFDYPLLCSMVSSATTYIVILIQFS
ncbi:Gustatory receptor 90d [Halyomorpha halys]|nr:Gustatory receptor 90d [Halyomorpha halys]